MWVRLFVVGLLVAVGAACQQAPAVSDDAPARCAMAKSAAVEAWDSALPTLRADADRAHEAASNCDGPTRNQPPCAGRMSDRFLAQSLTRARLSEVERAREATFGTDVLAMREAARDVKDAQAVEGAKRATASAYAACARPEVVAMMQPGSWAQLGR